jgi:NAD-dependent dihydropyrimidine dehydrogenase PreA subunit
MRLFSYLKNGETLSLDVGACVGCGACEDVCPHGVFHLESGKAAIVRRSGCMECGACALNCPASAIQVKTGVGCAAAILLGAMRGTAPDCGSSCDGNSGCC